MLVLSPVWLMPFLWLPVAVTVPDARFSSTLSQHGQGFVPLTSCTKSQNYPGLTDEHHRPGMTLLVILGAGATHDASRFARGETQPPLARRLFDERREFGPIVARYPR